MLSPLLIGSFLVFLFILMGSSLGHDFKLSVELLNQIIFPERRYNIWDIRQMQT